MGSERCSHGQPCAATCPGTASHAECVIVVSLSFPFSLGSCVAVGDYMLTLPSFPLAGGILGALFNALNYWLTMFRIR